MTDKIAFKLVDTNILTRWPCNACGGHTEKVSILCEAKTPSGKLRVCETCLREGDIDGRLERHAAACDSHASQVRALIGRLEVPSYESWEVANLRSDIEFLTSDFWHRGESPLLTLVKTEIKATADSSDPEKLRNTAELCEQLRHLFSITPAGTPTGLDDEIPF